MGIILLANERVSEFSHPKISFLCCLRVIDRTDRSMFLALCCCLGRVACVFECLVLACLVCCCVFLWCVASGCVHLPCLLCDVFCCFVLFCLVLLSWCEQCFLIFLSRLVLFLGFSCDFSCLVLSCRVFV
jgi:hypothetical protein